MVLKHILLCPDELADTYALKTLYDYLEPRIDELNIGFLAESHFFGFKTFSHLESKIIDSAAIIDNSSPGDLYVKCYSDINDGKLIRRKTVKINPSSLAIDISLLKSAIVPMTQEGKIQLRKKYGVPLDEPITVVSFDVSIEDATVIAHTLSPHSKVYFVGATPKSNFRLPKGLRNKVKVVSTYGIMKDYYAMADVAINGHNIDENSYHHMHNFIEATEGGPLFMVKPKITAQYGYRDLRFRRVIRECRNLSQILCDSLTYLKTFKTKKTHTIQRNRHLSRTRKEYLPTIESYIFKLANLTKTPLSSDLTVKRFSKNRIRLRHPETEWQH